MTNAVEGSAIAVDATHVYWTRGGTSPPAPPDGAVMRAPKDGGESSEIVGGQTRPIALARSADYVYWAGLEQTNPPVYRRPVSGGAVASVDAMGAFLLLEDDANVYAVGRAVRRISKSNGEVVNLFTASELGAAALGGGRVFFVEVGQRDISSVPIGGGAVEKVVSRTGPPYFQIAADETHVYWFDPPGPPNPNQPAASSIWAAPHTVGPATKLADTVGKPGKIAVYEGALYWTIDAAADDASCAGRTEGWPSLQTVPTAGGTVRTIASGYPSTRGFSNNGLAFDGTHVYWLTGSDGCTPSVRDKVMRAPR